jgi:hypothetical protein
MSEHKCNDKTPLVDAALAHQGDTHTDVTIRLMNLTKVARDLEIRLRQTLSASKRMVNAGIKNEYEIEQILGKALGYPWFKDDQKNFPGATEEHGVCVGEHVAVTLAMEAAAKITELTKERDEALARPSQHEGAHATCWAEVERLQAALAQAQTALRRIRDVSDETIKTKSRDIDDWLADMCEIHVAATQAMQDTGTKK